MEYGDEMNLEVFKTMESALKQDLVCLPLTSFYPFTGCSPDLLSLRLLRLNTVSRKDDGEALATHSSTLAWRIPGTGEPGGLPSMGSHRVRQDRKSTRLNSSHSGQSRMPSSA